MNLFNKILFNYRINKALKQELESVAFNMLVNEFRWYHKEIEGLINLKLHNPNKVNVCAIDGIKVKFFITSKGKGFETNYGHDSFPWNIEFKLRAWKQLQTLSEYKI